MELRTKIRRCEDHWRELFAESRSFCDGVIRWNNPKMDDQYTTNTFYSEEAMSQEAVQAAYDYQKEKNLHFLQLMCRQALDSAIAEHFSLKEELVLTMALQGSGDGWKTHLSLQIKDVQSEDIAADIIDFHLKQEADALKISDYAKRQILQDLDAVSRYPEYHWLAGYIDDKMVGLCHVLCFDGCVEIDDLVVDETARRQYVATTMLKHIVQQFEGIKYLHADAQGSSKSIYEKLGFVTVDSCWEYRNTKI